MARKALLIEQLHKVRSYTSTLVDAFPETQWFQTPPGVVTHVAWQVGHLAIAEYRLAIQRRRGVRPEDDQIIPSNFVQLFGIDSVPVADPHDYPSIADIRKAFDLVHQCTMSELVEVSEEELAEPPAFGPQKTFSDKGGAVQWCAMHEMLHAGQLGLLRRLFGYAPLR